MNSLYDSLEITTFLGQTFVEQVSLRLKTSGASVISSYEQTVAVKKELFSFHQSMTTRCASHALIEF